MKGNTNTTDLRVAEIESKSNKCIELIPTYIANSYASSNDVQRCHLIYNGLTGVGWVKFNLSLSMADMPNAINRLDIGYFPNIHVYIDGLTIAPAQSGGDNMIVEIISQSNGLHIMIGNYSGSILSKNLFFRIEIPVMVKI